MQLGLRDAKIKACAHGEPGRSQGRGSTDAMEGIGLGGLNKGGGPNHEVQNGEHASGGGGVD